MVSKALFLVAVLTLGPGVVEGLLGGWSDVIIDQTVKDVLQFAVVKHNEQTNDMYLRQVARVISAQSQLVNGMNYKFLVQMGRTACKKTGVETECPVHGDPLQALPYRCTFVVYKQWNGTSRLTSASCP